MVQKSTLSNKVSTRGLSRLKRGKLIRRCRMSLTIYGPFGGYVPYYSRHTQYGSDRLGRCVMDDFGTLVEAIPRNYHGIDLFSRHHPKFSSLIETTRIRSVNAAVEALLEASSFIHRTLEFKGETIIVEKIPK